MIMAEFTIGNKPSFTSNYKMWFNFYDNEVNTICINQNMNFTDVSILAVSSICCFQNSCWARILYFIEETWLTYHNGYRR